MAVLVWLDPPEGTALTPNPKAWGAVPCCPVDKEEAVGVEEEVAKGAAVEAEEDGKAGEAREVGWEGLRGVAAGGGKERGVRLFAAAGPVPAQTSRDVTHHNWRMFDCIKWSGAGHAQTTC